MDQFSWALEQFTSCTEKKEQQQKKKRLRKEEKTGARHRRTVHDIQLTGSVSVVSFLWRRVGLRLCVWEHAILNVALKNSHQAAPCWPWAESEQTLQAGNQDFNRVALSSDPESLGQMQDVTTTPHPLLLFSPLPPAPSHYPICQFSSTSFHQHHYHHLLFVSSCFIGWLLTLWPIRSTPPRCAGMNGPPCGPASPSWGRPPHDRGPDGRTDSRVARVDGGACRKRSLGGKQRSWWGRK